MARIIQIITLFILSLLMMSSSCDKRTEGCTDDSFCDYQGDGIEDENCACNYDKDAIIDDGSCNYPEENFDCAGNCIETWDCFGTCSGLAIVDNCEICCGGLTEIECVIDGTCPECPAGEELGCFGCDTNEIIYDCAGICGGMAFTDDCNQCVGGLTDSKTFVNAEIEDEIENCHYYDQLVGTCQENWALDCSGECFGEAIEDACEICVGGDSNEIGQSWRINIIVMATLRSQYDLPLDPDTNYVVIGAFMNASDGWNTYQGECPNNESDNVCYSDIVYNPEGPNPNYTRFYFPHPEWENDIPASYNTTDIKQDIRANDLHMLFSEGIIWGAKLESEPPSNVIDSLYFEFIYLEKIETCQIALKINGEELEIDPFENKMEMQVDFNGTIPIEIKVSEICFQ